MPTNSTPDQIVKLCGCTYQTVGNGSVAAQGIVYTYCERHDLNRAIQL
jgi:hypothetical protein